MAKGNKRNRNRRSHLVRELFVVDSVNVATATTVNTVIYTNTASTAGLELPVFWKFNSAMISASGGNNGSRWFFLLRRIPQGYSAPTVSIATGQLALSSKDILAYGMINDVTGSSAFMFGSMKRVYTSVTLAPGDIIVLQIINDLANTGLTADATIDYSFGSL